MPRAWRHCVPHLLHLVAALLSVNMHGLHLVADLQSKAQALFGDAGPAVEGDDNQRLGEVFHAHGAIDGDLACDPIVVALDRAHGNDQGGNEDRSDPCAFSELGDQHDDKRDAGGDGAHTVDDHAVQCAFAALSLPVHHHARLREREREKRADGEQRDQPIGDAAKDDQQERSEAYQRNDAVGVKQAAAADLEHVRQVVVHRDGARKTGEVGVRRVRREREHREDRADGEVVEPAAAHDRGGKLRQDAPGSLPRRGP